MKKYLYPSILTLLLSTLLIYSQESLVGSKEGLLLWYNIVLPTLLPFLILSNLLIISNGYTLINVLLGPPVKFLFKTSKSGTFPVIIGFLCGYPLGAKTTSDLYLQGKISKSEAYYLLSFTNNASPMFILGVLVTQFYQDEKLLVPTLFILCLAPYITSLFTRHYYKFDNSTPNPTNTNSFNMNINIIDQCIINSVNIIVKIGAYIILFSILISITKHVFHHNSSFFLYAISTFELTNGLKILMQSNNYVEQYISTMTLVSFSGICAITQTSSVLTRTDLSIKPYIIQKIITALATVIISYFYIIYLY